MLPLKGKILNVYKTAAEKVLASEEILNILKSIGYDPSKPDPMRSLRVGKIILLGDADADGGHINTLNMCLLARYIPQVFTAGMVYVAKGAEYVIETEEKLFYANSPDEMRKKVPASLMSRLLHLKGWGELSARGLHELAFNPKTRFLTKITMPNKKDMKMFQQLMGDDISYRRLWLGI
jgi:DNA gyrase/topoisomerase IV subunit B